MIIIGILTVNPVEDESFLQQDINCLCQRELTHKYIHVMCSSEDGTCPLTIQKVFSTRDT